MNVLVTGGAGFIGSHVVDALLVEKHRVTVLDNFSSGKKENVAARCLPVEGDVRDPDVVDHCMRGQNVAFHLAAFSSVPQSVEDPETCIETNVTGTRHVLESACRAGASRIVFASTSAVYPGFPDTPKDEAEAPEPKSPYAESKLEGEKLLRWFYERNGLGYVSFRYFNVYGPRQDVESEYAAVIPLFILRSLAGATLIIDGDGRQSRDFVYVGDVVRANLRAMETTACGVFNVGTGWAVSVVELADRIVRRIGSRSGLRFGPSRRGDVRSSTADIRSISSTLGWSPEWSLDDGLTATIDWFRSQERVLFNRS